MDTFSKTDKHTFNKFTNLSDWGNQWLTEWQRTALYRNLVLHCTNFTPVNYTVTVNHICVEVKAYQNRELVGFAKVERDW